MIDNYKIKPTERCDLMGFRGFPNSTPLCLSLSGWLRTNYSPITLSPNNSQKNVNKKHQDPFSRFSHDLWDILGHHRPRLAPSRHRSLWLQLRWPRSTCRAGLLRWRPKIWRLVFRLSLRQLTDWPVLNSRWDPKVKPTLGCPRVNWSPEITCGHHCVVLMMSSTHRSHLYPVGHRMAFSGWAPSIEGTHLRKTLGKVIPK